MSRAIELVLLIKRSGSVIMTKKKKTNLKEQDVVFQLYLNPGMKKQYIRDYEVLIDTHDRTYLLMYKELKEHSTEVMDKYRREGEEFINKHFSFNPEYDDPGDYYERIEKYAIQRMEEQSLMHYQFELMSLSNLYQIFEQQLRKWLFKEMTHTHNEYINQIEFVLEDEENDYGKFFSKFGALHKLLEEMNFTFKMPVSTKRGNPKLSQWFDDEEDNFVEVRIIETEIWQLIRECNLLSNTFKHGSGPTAKVLYEEKPQYFNKVNETKLMNLYLTTNLEEVLNVKEISFGKYANAMKQFWEKMKTHQSGSIKLMIDISAEPAVKNQ